jgi:hypothetical protein
MALKKVNDETLRKAKKAGFKTSAPKKPLKSATPETLKRYIVRYNEWVDKVNKAAKKVQEAETLRKQIFKS